MLELETWSPEIVRWGYSALQEGLKKLQECVRSTPAPASARLMARLETVQERLADYFRLDEHNGFMAAVLKRNPAVAHEVDNLIDERRDLIMALEAVIADVKFGSSSHGAVRRKIEQWIAALRDHECRKNVLTEDAFNRDECAED